MQVTVVGRTSAGQLPLGSVIRIKLRQAYMQCIWLLEEIPIVIMILTLVCFKPALAVNTEHEFHCGD